MPQKAQSTGKESPFDLVYRLLANRQSDEAAKACEKIVESHPGNADAWLLFSQVQQARGLVDSAHEMAERADGLRADNALTLLQIGRCTALLGRIDTAVDKLLAAENIAGSNYTIWQSIALVYTSCGRHEDAHRCYLQSHELVPDDAACLFNLATSFVTLGKIDHADQAFSKVISLSPDDYEAYRSRSELRKQTTESNHVEELQNRLRQPVVSPAGESQLCYALAKELEDLGRYKQSFVYLKRGADKRRSIMRYDVSGDLEVLARLTQVFDRNMFCEAGVGFPGKGPIFILGLPRSGTTLVDRIISSHSQVESLGEIQDFALCLTRLAASGKKMTKLQLLEQSASIDFHRLGQAYCENISSRAPGVSNFIDKTPLNYLYIGLIALALPKARLIHVYRNPMDSCYAIYKTLFRMGYPFSYEMSELGQYYIAYWKLMQHWNMVLPGRIFDVSYEALVGEQEQVSRKIIEYCGLQWEDQCLRFHEHSSPAATASAIQVRQPIYSSSVKRWRSYEVELGELRRMLRTAGIDTGN